VILGVDKTMCDSQTAAEATKVRLDGDRVTAIGKSLYPYDALDTGLFVCDPIIFDALEASCAAGDSTLSGGVRRLAERRLVRGITISNARWYDIDTIDDLTAAEHLLRSTIDL
jgi:choline kinase